MIALLATGWMAGFLWLGPLSVGLVRAAEQPLVPAGTLFHWVDKAGIWHVTDQLAKVPEPFYSSYKAQLLEADARRQARGESAGAGGVAKPSVHQGSGGAAAQRGRAAASRRPGRRSVSGSRGIIAQEEARRERWRATMREARSALLRATGELKKIDDAIAQARANPILRETPPVRAKIAQLTGQRANALRWLEKAREHLTTTLPKRARKEGVPPKWLQ